MAPSFSDIVEEARLSARALLDYGDSFFNPTVRLGVTGLSRAGKTVFITALVHGLTRGGRFPVFALCHGPDRPRPARAAAGRCRAALRL
jgi:predicted YcjX-like family ATPase